MEFDAYVRTSHYLWQELESRVVGLMPRVVYR
jgi:hypothetical protein